MKVLYLYSGMRRGIFIGTPGVAFPDTQLYGLNHLDEYGIDAEYRELNDILPKWFVEWLPFSIRHILSYFLVTDRHNIVFGSSVLYTLLLQKVYKKNAQFVLLNLGLTRTLQINQRKPFRLRLIHWLLKEASAVVCLSDAQKKFIVHECPFLRGRVHTVLLGVDSKYHMPVFQDRDDSILSVGRDNGRDYKTVAELADKLPDRSFVFVCSKRNVQNVPLPKNVTVYYDISYRELRKLYETAGMLVLSTHPDHFGDGSDLSGQTVLLDALASGLPIIASKKAYLKEYVSEGDNIYIVPPYDVTALTEAILQMSDPILAERMARHGRTQIEESLSTQHMGERLHTLFTTIHA